MSQVNTRDYPEQVILRETPEGKVLLRVLADRHGISVSALIRMLVRREAKRLGVQP